MNISKVFLVITFVSAFSLQACAPGLSSTLKLPLQESKPNSELGIDPNQVVFVPVKIEVDTDNRDTTFVGKINERQLLPDGDYNSAVSRIVENKLKSIGATVSFVATTVVSCSVKDLYVDVVSSFPMSSAHARAQLVITVTDELTGQKYTTDYSGESETKNPFLTELSVQNALISAIDSALTATLEDQGFKTALGLI